MESQKATTTTKKLNSISRNPKCCFKYSTSDIVRFYWAVTSLLLLYWAVVTLSFCEHCVILQFSTSLSNFHFLVTNLYIHGLYPISLFISIFSLWICSSYLTAAGFYIAFSCTHFLFAFPETSLCLLAHLHLYLPNPCIFFHVLLSPPRLLPTSPHAMSSLLISGL